MKLTLSNKAQKAKPSANDDSKLTISTPSYPYEFLWHHLKMASLPLTLMFSVKSSVFFVMGYSHVNQPLLQVCWFGMVRELSSRPNWILGDGTMGNLCNFPSDPHLPIGCKMWQVLVIWQFNNLLAMALFLTCGCGDIHKLFC